MEMTRANKQRLIIGPIVLLVAVVLLIFWKNAPILFVAFMSPVFTIALVSYTLAYYRYERG